MLHPIGRLDLGFCSILTNAFSFVQIQSDLICKLASENILDILITISSLSGKTEYNRYNTVCLEIFYLIFRGVERPDLLVRKSAEVTKILREEKLGALLEAENSRKRMEGRRGVTRHSRFGTTVMIQTVSLPTPYSLDVYVRN